MDGASFTIKQLVDNEWNTIFCFIAALAAKYALNSFDIENLVKESALKIS